ncbi:MAG TPA: PPC domain-containing protein, partial [Actinomycetota bacterium]|nr:PPC domain-containing protein [Actinomycetota bacterium]
MHRIARLLAAVLLVATLPAIAPAAPKAPVHVGSLTMEAATFWDGGHVGSDPTYSLPFTGVPFPDRCASVDPCFVYTFDVTATSPTARLRVGLDTPARDDGFEMTLISPANVAASRQNSNSYSMELFANAPETGTWTVKVVPVSADHASFRMRAK